MQVAWAIVAFAAAYPVARATRRWYQRRRAE
jgi:hypothetical protein